LFIVSWTLLMVRRLSLLFSVDIVVDGQPPCWSSFVASISAGLSIIRRHLVVNGKPARWTSFCHLRRPAFALLVFLTFRRDRSFVVAIDLSLSSLRGFTRSLSLLMTYNTHAIRYKRFIYF
jgi:hypothetical protein